MTVDLLSPIALSSDMGALEVLRRFAAHGVWLDARHPVVRERVQPLADRLGKDWNAVAAQLQKDPRKYGAAIRRQWGTRILWYVRPAADVLACCVNADPAAPLIDVLDLHEADSVPASSIEESDGAPLRQGVTLDAGWPVQAAVERPRQKMVGFERARDRSAPAEGAAGGGTAPAAGPRRGVEAPAPTELLLWPRCDAPQVQQAGQVFEVVVGFGATQQAGVAGAQARLPVEAGRDTVDVSIELTATDALEAPDGWQRPLRVAVADPTAATATFRLVGRPPTNGQGIALTMLEVRYLVAGTVCGTAARALAIVAPGAAATPAGEKRGQGWDELAGPAAPVELQPDPAAPDLTLEILKPDGDVSSGSFVCRLYSPHALSTPLGPYAVSLGTDARSFARQQVDELRAAAASGVLVDLSLESTGRLVADRLPAAFFTALREVAAKVAGPPALLIVSTEHFIPWELAWLDDPIDPGRPAFLGAQALVGRWLRGDGRSQAPGGTQRPATHPKSHLPVRNVAVMTAVYRMESGLGRLPKAEEEARLLSGKLPAVLLPARSESVQQVLAGHLPGRAGWIDAVHFAGHGNFDASRVDGATLYLEDGGALESRYFRAARYGGEQQPLMFLNACMGGIGGDVLGDMGGFPGHSLRGGFGGVVGALWEVDDQVAQEVALAFWQRALPAAQAVDATDPDGAPVAAILRDLRGGYTREAPVPTLLAYVYYGHPRLTLQRVNASPAAA